MIEEDHDSDYTNYGAEIRVPAFCPVCGFIMKGKSTYTYYDHKCCQHCFIHFLEDRPEKIKKWDAGWRPEPEEIKRFQEMMRQPG